MEQGQASKTAMRVAHRRAVHQLLDNPPVLCDSIAVQLCGPTFTYDPWRESTLAARAIRAFMAVRSRFAEDRLAASVSRGIGQYVILGAGLDTFAYRNPFPDLRVFEVDFPATQQWKRQLLAQARIEPEVNVTYVPLDFEKETLVSGLTGAGFDRTSAAFFSWLGVVPYLSIEAFRATLSAIALLPSGTEIIFDFGLSPKALNFVHRLAFRELSRRVAAAGEPFRIFFTPEEMEAELSRVGFSRSVQSGAEELNALYFSGRTDRLRLPVPGLARMVAAWI